MDTLDKKPNMKCFLCDLIYKWDLLIFYVKSYSEKNEFLSPKLTNEISLKPVISGGNKGKKGMM